MAIIVTGQVYAYMIPTYAYWHPIYLPVPDTRSGPARTVRSDQHTGRSRQVRVSGSLAGPVRFEVALLPGASATRVPGSDMRPMMRWKLGPVLSPVQCSSQPSNRCLYTTRMEIDEHLLTRL
jgi:hypothetical protein